VIAPSIMETAKLIKVNGKNRIVLEPRIVNLILEMNKLMSDAIEVNKEMLKLIGEV